MPPGIFKGRGPEREKEVTSEANPSRFDPTFVTLCAHAAQSVCHKTML